VKTATDKGKYYTILPTGEISKTIEIRQLKCAEI
jgi:hypothetical protein